MWQLFGLLRNGESLKHDFHPDRLTIGRATTNSIQLEDETVSSLHAEIELIAPGRYMLRDLGSKNGTFVDGVAIAEIEISKPCKISFGVLTFDFGICSEEEMAENPEREDGAGAGVAALRARCEKLRDKSDSERKDFSKQIARITRENDARLLEEQKAREELNRTIEQLKGAHGAELETQRREHSGKIGDLERQSEARLLERQKECEGLNRTIEELKGAHGEELESQRREHSGKIADLERQSEARLLERQKECEDLNRTIAQLKEAHGAELESQRQEHSGKITDLERQSEARLLERQKECEDLNRTIAQLRDAHGAQLENERREHRDRVANLERESVASLAKKQEESEALNRAVEELKRALILQAEAHRNGGGFEPPGKVAAEKAGSLETAPSAAEPVADPLEKRPADSSPSGKSSESKSGLAAAKPRFTRAMLASRRTGQWVRLFLLAGVLGFGLMCLLAQSLPPTVLPSMNPIRLVSPSEGGGAPSAATEEWETPNAHAIPQNGASDFSSSQEVADKGPKASPGDHPNEAQEAQPPAAAPGSAEISMDPSVTRGQPLALIPKAEKAAAAGAVGNPATSKPGEATENAPSEQPADASTRTSSADKRAAPANRIAQALASPCPCATDDLGQGGRSGETAGRFTSEPAGASIPDANAVNPGPLREAAPDRAAAAPSEPGQEGGLAVGFKLQEEHKAAPESANTGSERGASDPNAPAAERSDSTASPSGDGSGAVQGSPELGDQAKAEFPASLSKALGHKASPGGKNPKAPHLLRVLILGDSLSLCGFGKRLDQKFREDPQVQSVFTYMACGTHPLSWIKEKPYTTVKTHCGYWSIESSEGQPKEMEDTYGMTPGHVPKPHPVPKLEDLLEKIHPDILVMQCGTNLFSLFENRKTVQPVRDAPMLRNYIAPFMNAARKCASLKKIYWVAPPTSGRTPTEIQDFVFTETCATAGWIATVIDSRPLVAYPYHHMEPDHEHFMGTDMTQWAERSYSFMKQDLSSKPFSSLPALAQLQPPADLDAPKKKEPDATREPLYVQAKLAFKSQPIPLKELMPYQESLVGFVYDVSRVVDGKYEDKQILVLHPSCIGLKPQPLDKYKTGKMYNLRLHEVETTPWHTVRCQDESGRIDLIPYIQVEDEKKFPGNSH